MASERDKTVQAARVNVGHCPECRAVVVVLNDYETWPLVYCACGWVGPTTAIDNKTRFERGGVIFDVYRPEVTA